MRTYLRRGDDWLRAIAYVFTATGGGWLFLYQPPLVVSGGPTLIILTLAWASLICAALPAAVATYRGKFATEYWCLPLFTGGLVLALLHAYFNLTPDAVPRVAFITALACLFAARFIVLHRIVKLAAGEK